MATTVGSLLIDIRADVASLRGDLGKASAIVQQQQAQITGSLDKMRSGFAAVGTAAKGMLGVFAIRAVVSFGRASLDAAGGLGELAEQLGVSTEALQVYQYAAAQAGVSAEQLEGGLSKLSRTIGEAASGNKEAADAFRNLGILILDANGQTRSTEAIFADIADAIAAIEDPAKRAAVAVEIFGRNGQRLMPILSQGRSALAEFEAQARRAGAVLSTGDIADADKAADGIAAMTFQFSRLAQALTAISAPTIVSGLKTLNYAVQSLRNGWKLLSSQEVYDAQRAFLSQQTDLAKLASELDRTTVGTEEYADAVKRYNEALDRWLVLRDKLVQAQRTALGQNPDGTTGSGTATVTAPAPTQGNRFATARPPGGGGGAQRSALDERMAELRNRQAEEYADSLERQRNLLNPVRELQNAYASDMRTLNEALTSTNESLRITSEEYERLADAARGRLSEGIARIKGKTEEASDSGRAFGQIMESAFEDAIIAGKGYREVLQGILSDIARVVLRQTITQPLGNAVSSIAGNMFGNLFGSSGGGGLKGPVGAPKAFASGGRPPLGRVSLVGEEGPELFVPDVAGTILPGGFASMASRSPLVFNIDARQSRLSASEMRAIVSSAVTEARVMVVDDARRGGSRSALLRGR